MLEATKRTRVFQRNAFRFVGEKDVNNGKKSYNKFINKSVKIENWMKICWWGGVKVIYDWNVILPHQQIFNEFSIFSDFFPTVCSTKRKNSVLETFWQWKMFLPIFFLIPRKLPLKNVHTSTIVLRPIEEWVAFGSAWTTVQQMGLKIKAVAEALYGVQHYRVLYAVQTPPTPKSGF